MMTRKNFLKIAGIAGIITSIGAVGFFTASFENAVAEVILKQLNFLKLDKEGVYQFARDFSKRKSKKEQLVIKAYRIAGVKPSQSQRIHDVINMYLLSTDFFTNKMDETKTLKYKGLYNPYFRPCAHPFSHVYYS